MILLFFGERCRFRLLRLFFIFLRLFLLFLIGDTFFGVLFELNLLVGDLVGLGLIVVGDVVFGDVGDLFDIVLLLEFFVVFLVFLRFKGIYF